MATWFTTVLRGVIGPPHQPDGGFTNWYQSVAIQKSSKLDAVAYGLPLEP